MALDADPDHSTAGAREALTILGPTLGRLVGYAVAGHHAGLADGNKVALRLRKPLEPYDEWRDAVGALPEHTDFVTTRRLDLAPEAGFTLAFLTRMIFSCLVDADRL